MPVENGEINRLMVIANPPFSALNNWDWDGENDDMGDTAMGSSGRWKRLHSFRT